MPEAERQPPSYPAILAAAEALFGERGYRKATLEEVAARAGVTRPIVYRHFGDKRGLFAEVVARVLREWNEVLAAEAARPTPSTAHTFRLVLSACLDFARSRTVLRGLLLRDAGLVRFLVGDTLDAGRALLPALVQRILEDGIRRGEVRGDLAVEDMAHVVSEVFVSYALLALEGDGAEAGARRVDAVIETLLHGVIAPVGG